MQAIFSIAAIGVAACASYAVYRVLAKRGWRFAFHIAAALLLAAIATVAALQITADHAAVAFMYVLLVLTLVNTAKGFFRGGLMMALLSLGGTVIVMGFLAVLLGIDISRVCITPGGGFEACGG